METDEMTAGVLDVIAEEVEHRQPQPKAEETQTPAETPKPEPKQETKPVEEPKPAEPEASETPKETPAPESTTPETETETTEPSQVNPDAETSPEEIDWKSSLPAPPPKYEGKTPDYDEQGNITNMTALEYENYLIARADERQSERSYISTVENRALDAAEQILPQIKTSPEIRQMVEDARIASVFRGQQIDSYEAAKLVRKALGLSNVDQRVAQAKAEGAQSAKTHIEVQKNAAVETRGATQKKAEPTVESKLMRRLKRGESDAMVELMDLWQDQKKV